MMQMTLTPIHKSLTTDELQQALEILGLRLFRFHYSAQLAHNLSFRLQVFVDGKIDQVSSDHILRQKDGEQVLCLYFYQRADVVEIKAQGATSMLGWPAISMTGYNARTHYQYQETSLSSAYVPLLVYAANHDSIQGIGCTPDGCGILPVPVEDIVRDHEWALVISACIQTHSQKGT